MINGIFSKLNIIIIVLIAVPILSCTRDLNAISEDEYLKLHDNQIDIALGSLLIEKAIFPDIDIQEKLNEIDRMQEELRELLEDKSEPSLIIKIINNYLFNVKKLKSNDDYHFLINVLNEKYGNCSALSCLYLSITDRLNLPFYGVSSPEHMFVRYEDKGVRYSIGVTANGGLISVHIPDDHEHQFRSITNSVPIHPEQSFRLIANSIPEHSEQKNIIR